MINSSMKVTDFLLEHMITDLLQLCKSELGINQMPKIKILSNEPSTGGGMSFGEFRNNSIEVVSMNRHPMDVARTLAHELVHWKQRLNGEEMDGSDGSNTENDANAIAGVIMRKFAKQHPDYFTL